MRIFFVSIVFFVAAACKKKSNDDHATAQMSAAVKEQSRWSQVFKNAKMSEQSRAAIVRLSNSIKPQIMKTAESIQKSAIVLKNGSAQEKASFVVRQLAAVADPALPVAVSLFASDKSVETRRRIESEIRKQMGVELTRIEAKIAADIERKKFPVTPSYFGAGLEGQKNFLALLGVSEDPKVADEIIAALPAEGENAALGLTSEPTGDCSPFLGKSKIQQCSNQVLGLKWIEFAVPAFFIGLLLLLVSPLVAIVPLVIGVVSFVHGAYLAWGSAIQ